MERVLSGIRPTGVIHVGNYLGAIRQWVALSHEPRTECYFMIADYHALLSHRDTPLGPGALDLVAWELAAGLDPNKDRVTLFVQSKVPAHAELAWILNTLVSVSELSRMTQYKDLLAQDSEKPTAALLTYPVLQAADILLYKADVVPVGEDQVQHVELTRLLARRLNQLVGRTIFPQPQARLTESSRVMSLDDPSKKMAKSSPAGALLMTDDATILRAKIDRAITDSGPDASSAPAPWAYATPHVTPELKAHLFVLMSPGTRNLFTLLDALDPNSAAGQRLLLQYRDQTIQYHQLKEAVADAVVEFVAPLQSRFREIRADESVLRDILRAGTAAASRVASQTLREVKQGLKLFSFADDDQSLAA